MAAFFKIDASYASEMKRGAFLSPGDEKTQRGDSDNPTYTWRETLLIEDVEVKGEADGKEMVVVKFRVPNDVVSKNTGRAVTEWFRFPWADAQMGNKTAQMITSINYRGLTDMLTAAGFTGELSSLDQIPVASLRNMRVNAQVKLGPDDEGTMRQRIGFYRAVKL